MLQTTMKKLLLSILLVALTVAQNSIFDKHQKELNFINYSKKHHKKYTSLEESLYRLSIYKDNLNVIDKRNKENPNAKFGVNKFSDLSQEEFLERYAGAQLPIVETAEPKRKSSKSVRGAAQYPASLDLRKTAGMQPIRDQGQCGSCWAFSAVSTIEYAYWKKTGYSGDLSEQQMVDCVYSYNGCRGGWMSSVYYYAANYGGIAWEWDYPYTAEYGSCKTEQVKSKISVWLNQTTPYERLDHDDDTIKSYLANHGTISVCADVTGWSSYQSGIYRDERFDDQKVLPTCQHAVSIVGYDTENGVPYYIIRNSWDTWWGENGYIRLDARRHSTGYTYSGLYIQFSYVPILY